MSVKNKIKRLNNEVKKLQDELLTCQLSNNRLRQQLDIQKDTKMLENIIKFAITNHVGNLRAGMIVDINTIDKMKELRLNIDRNDFEHTYMIRVTY
jgi:hypothetical protein